jgi:uncharacterized membrane protein (UPF0127 family)
MRKKALVLNLSQNKIVLHEAGIADTFFLRFKGLLGCKTLPPGTGLIIKRCRAVHTVGMSFPIDVVFVDGKDCICYLLEGLAPQRFSPVVRQASYVIEAPAGTFGKTQTKSGDRVRLQVLIK